MKSFPSIPSDVTGLLKDIISKCLVYDYQDRMELFQLKQNMILFFSTDSLTDEDMKIPKEEDVTEQLIKNNPLLSQRFSKINENALLLTEMSRLLSDQYLDEIKEKKDSVNLLKDRSLTSLSENNSNIKNKLTAICLRYKNLVDELYDFLINRIAKTQQKLNDVLHEVLESGILSSSEYSPRYEIGNKHVSQPEIHQWTVPKFGKVDI